MIKLFFIVAFVNSGLCIVVISRFKFDYNSKFLVVDVKTMNIPGKPTLINICFDFKGEFMDKMMMYVKISVAEDKNGMKTRKEFMRTAIDVPKLFNGGLTSMIGKTFLTGLEEAADFELKFPKKTGVYKINNFTITDQFVPFLMAKEVILDLRFTGNVKKNSNTMNFLAHADCVGSIQ